MPEKISHLPEDNICMKACLAAYNRVAIRGNKTEKIIAMKKYFKQSRQIALAYAESLVKK